MGKEISTHTQMISESSKGDICSLVPRLLLAIFNVRAVTFKSWEEPGDEAM